MTIFTPSCDDVKQRKFSLGPHRSGYGPEKIEVAPHSMFHHGDSFVVCSCFCLDQLVGFCFCFDGLVFVCFESEIFLCSFASLELTI